MIGGVKAGGEGKEKNKETSIWALRPCVSKTRFPPRSQIYASSVELPRSRSTKNLASWKRAALKSEQVPDAGLLWTASSSPAARRHSSPAPRSSCPIRSVHRDQRPSQLRMPPVHTWTPRRSRRQRMSFLQLNKAEQGKKKQRKIIVVHHDSIFRGCRDDWVCGAESGRGAPATRRGLWT
jgi:hypothetical protein